MIAHNNQNYVAGFAVDEIALRADRELKKLSDNAFLLWAKSGDETGWLSLPQHMVDSACVAAYLWNHWVSKQLRDSLLGLTKLSEDELASLFVFLAGVHDIGKATPFFADLLRDSPDKSWLGTQLEEAGYSMAANHRPSLGKITHGFASKVILKKWLHGQIGLRRKSAERLSQVVDAHHGKPTADVDRNERGLKYKAVEALDLDWQALARELLEAVAEIADFKVEDIKAEPAFSKKYELNADSLQLLTGLVIMSDWIASNQDLFPYSPAQNSLEYTSLERTRQAMEGIDLTAPWEHRSVPQEVGELYRTAFGWNESRSVRPVQQAAVETAKLLSKQPGAKLILIEAPTGEGKTEAALAVVQILGEANGAQGVYLAAPTMATANGLYNRTADWVRQVTTGESVSSMYLAHSKNRLNEDFSKLPRISQIESDGELRNEPGNRTHGAIIASQWLSGRKKGLLSNFSVGTIDQVLMLALQQRHSMLRHVALAGKVIIIDEVHAVDAYMSEYLKTALSWLARYGATVIMLSATLAPSQRHELLKAFSSQVRMQESCIGKTLVGKYPLISIVSTAGVEYLPVEARPDDLTAEITTISDDQETLQKRVAELLAEGGIALVICNTIRRAQEAYQTLREVFPPDEVQLHHSAFIARERAQKEDLLREALGPSASTVRDVSRETMALPLINDENRNAQRPTRLVVVATQVAEQSLDIDVDVLITDIAPIDLVIQRIGRLHRHSRSPEERPVAVRAPKVFVRGVVNDSGVPKFDGGAKAIYGDALLLASYAALETKFRRPSDVEGLVRKVYEAVDEGEIGLASQLPKWKESWEAAWNAAVAAQRKLKERLAERSRTFRVPEPSYASSLENLFERIIQQAYEKVGEEEAGSAQVRDSEMSIEAIAIQRDINGYRLFGDDPGDSFADVSESELTPKSALRFAAGSVPMPSHMMRTDRDFEDVITALEQMTPTTWRKNPYLRGVVAIDFDYNGVADVGRYVVKYSKELGLSVEVKGHNSDG